MVVVWWAVVFVCACQATLVQHATGKSINLTKLTDAAAKWVSMDWGPISVVLHICVQKGFQVCRGSEIISLLAFWNWKYGKTRSHQFKFSVAASYGLSRSIEWHISACALALIPHETQNTHFDCSSQDIYTDTIPLTHTASRKLYR